MAGVAGRPFLTAAWRHLAMLNYAVDPAVVRPLVPAGTALDSFGGVTYVSLVGFLFRDTRVAGWAVPGHVHFEELNLRCYVRREAAGEVRRGVVFVKELVPRHAITAVARWCYGENYQTVAMRHALTRDAGGTVTGAAYEWWHGGWWNRLAATATGPAGPLQAGSVAEFITEHYWGYARRRDGSTTEYRVAHPRWTVAPATAQYAGDVAALYGPQWVPYLLGEPRSAFLVDGSPVEVWPGERVG
ncbi:MAG: DUF2071 domain-containing protein [Fimbriimonadaceae bacterium]|nr:DUF2071 domain-containing protein [Fimbriimonadaceae bacterium]